MSKKKQRSAVRAPDARVVFVGPESGIKAEAVATISDIRTTTRRPAIPAGAGERLRRRLERETPELVYGEWRTGPHGRVAVYAVPGEDLFSGTSAAPAACTPVVLWVEADSEHADEAAQEWLRLLAACPAPVSVAVAGEGAEALAAHLSKVSPVAAVQAVRPDREGVGQVIEVALGRAGSKASSAA